MIGLAFFSLMVLTQKIRIIPLAAGKIITGFADYSYSLFLIHLTLMRVLVEIIPVEGVARIAVLIIASNICAFIFSILFEQHYRRVSEWIKNGITFALLKFERVAR
jgi:peptidoglycan/LPS O-acetylase OafA/YrhL